RKRQFAKPPLDPGRLDPAPVASRFDQERRPKIRVVEQRRASERFLVRTALYGAANILLSRVTRFSALKRWGVDVAKRRGTKRAKVALARVIHVSICKPLLWFLRDRCHTLAAL
ncbi:MAG TPA: hypothetical protein VGQ95_10380, partial [Chthoniobacterales bacterium]|nr:hypothetical protein [Chthoniobacterales bacterium]